MGTGAEVEQKTDDKLLLLIEKQMLTKEGSPAWYDIQGKINQIIAENFLRFVNR